MSMSDGSAEDFILGIDLGSNSVGWALVARTNGEPTGLIRAGARVFEAGMEGNMESGREESRNLKRREARQHRRQLWRRARRLRKVFHLLQRFGLLPPAKGSTPEERQDLINELDKEIMASEWFKAKEASASIPEPDQVVPYLLRATALDERLEPPFVGRALYHLAQRRGFLSNRKAPPKKDEKPGEVEKGINEIRDGMKQTGSRTLGEYFARLDPFERRIRQRWTWRPWYKEEFQKIWEAQAKHHQAVLTPERCKELHRAIFYQRPLRFPEELVGQCELESGEKRAPRYLFIAQRFRLLEEVNNLRIELPDGSVRGLTDEERGKLVRELELKGDQTFAHIRKKLLKLPNEARFTIERGSDKKVRGNRTTAAFYKVFGERWLEMSAAEHEQALHDVVSIQDDEALKRRAIQHWKLNEENAKKFAAISPESDYFRRSRVAMEKLLLLLETGVTYAEARRQMYPEKFEACEPVELLPALASDAARETVGEIRNPAVTRSLTELRKVVNAIVRTYGKPAQIRIELARSLKNPKKVRKAISESNRENEDERKEMAQKILDEVGISDPSPPDKRKAILWKECGGICPYTGKSIAFRDLFGGESQFDSEHIIPYERCFDNSFKNLTLCYHQENRHVKGGRTPWEAYGNTDGYQDILDRVRRFHSRAAREKLRRFQMTETEAAEFVSKFVERQMNDTRYASKLAAKYAAMLYGGLSDDEHTRRVHVTSGGVTAALRNAWLLNSILNDGATSGGGAVPKTRDDHRHHAVDAVAIALTDDAAIQHLSHASQQARERGARKLSLKEPWGKDLAEFVTSVREQINQVIVSHRVSKKISGALHEETIYSPPKKNRHLEPGTGKESYHVRKRLDSGPGVLSKSEVEEIVDRIVRERVQAKLQEHGNDDPKKVFADKNNLPSLIARDGHLIPIKKVRIRVSTSPFPIGKGPTLRHVLGGSNHHVEIYADADEPEEDREWEGKVITMYQAYQLNKEHKPIVTKQHEQGWEFRFSLSPGEVVECDDGPERRKLLVYKGVSQYGAGPVVISLLPINDARKNPKLIRRVPNWLLERHARKVAISPLGDKSEVSEAHD